MGEPAQDEGSGLVTIVVPAYNVERYLPACLSSLHAQTVWSDCRVIVVDDGSTDATGSIAAEAARDPQIQLLSQTNQGPGPGAARNQGLDRVSTEFVLFCDADDELTPPAIELLRDGLRRFPADLAIGASEQFPRPRTWLWSPYFVPGTSRQVQITDVPLLAHNASTGNKLFRTESLQASGYRFAEGIHHQDTVVTVPTMVRSKGIALIGDVVHRYRKRAEGDSIMDSQFTRIGNYWDHLEVIEQLGAQLDTLPPERRALMERFIARSFQGFAWRAPSRLPAEKLPDFFARTQAVITRLSVESIMTATRHAGERAAYVTMLEDDLVRFAALDAALDRLVADQGSLYLDLPTGSPERRQMLRAGRTRAWAEDLATTTEGISLTIRLRIRGARSLPSALSGVVLRLLSSTDQATRFATDLRLEPSAGDDLESAATVSVPRRRLTPGAYFLRLTLYTPTGHVSRWVRRPEGETGAAGGEPGRVGDEMVIDESAGISIALTHHGDRALLSVIAERKAQRTAGPLSWFRRPG